MSRLSPAGLQSLALQLVQLLEATPEAIPEAPPGQKICTTGCTICYVDLLEPTRKMKGVGLTMVVRFIGAFAALTTLQLLGGGMSFAERAGYACLATFSAVLSSSYDVSPMVPRSWY